ncbi:MAG TPA: type IV secretion system DNA-binding domain-containing protein [Candidatus Saccharimonadales bacterium]|nr:type IV secretion system DNA-binding domain-containing protein [Candidatus Saccharimonadales bacterium]
MEALNYLDTVIEHWHLIASVVVAVAVVYWALLVTRALINRRHLLRRQMVWLEITPPVNIAKTPEATEQLFSVIHGTRTARRLKDRLLGRSSVVSFEIVSTRKEGIRYLLQVEKSDSKNTQKAIAAYIPESKVKEVEPDNTALDEVIDFKQTGHYVLPLTLTSAFEQHDPLSYITGAMTTLNDDEQISLQLIATPVRLREAGILSHKILGNENILQQVSGRQLSALGRVAGIFNKATTGLTDLTGEIYMGTTYGYKNYYDSKSRSAQQQSHVTKHDRPARTLSAFELELMETMHRKVTQPLFQVNLRLLIKSSDATEHARALKSALDGYSVPPYQALKAKVRLPVLDSFRRKAALQRLPSLWRRSALVLASSELASLYHFPSSEVSKTDNLITSLSRTLPAPVSLKSGKRLAVTIGENHHHGVVTPIGLTEAERERHMYIIGGTGNGKTTILFYSILQDIRAGNGVAVLDPHGDLAERILRYIPKERIEDVIYMNPDDLAYPIGMNLLELSPDLTGDDLLREKDLITEATISVLRKIFSDDDSGGHRIEYILRNSIQTALTLEAPTLFTIFELLNDAKYRRKIVKGLTDKNLKDFWNNELGKAGDMQKVKMAAGITAKIGRFLFSASARRILEQPKSTVSFEDILAGRKILICNFSKGLLGEDTSSLFGTTVLAKLQTAALRRARISEIERAPYYLYVDEFQNFATTSFVQMLSEARKYKLFLTMAEQSTSQQDEQRLVDIILANVGTVVCFRSGSPSDERLVLSLFMPLIEQGEIANLPAYSYYVRIAAVHAQEPMSGVTVVIGDAGSEAISGQVIASSRRLYARKFEEETMKPDSASTKKSGVTRGAKKHASNKASDDLATVRSLT